MNGGEARLQDYGVSLGAGAYPKTRTLEGRSQLSHQCWGETLEYAMWGLWGWAKSFPVSTPVAINDPLQFYLD